MQLPRGNRLDVVYVILSNDSNQLRVKLLSTFSELKMMYSNTISLFTGLYSENNWQRDANPYNIREIGNKIPSDPCNTQSLETVACFKSKSATGNLHRNKAKNNVLYPSTDQQLKGVVSKCFIQW
jgi:hypothetical protein